MTKETAMRTMAMIGPDQAETIAATALDYLATRPDEFSAFITTTGVDLETFKQSAANPDALAAILDFVLTDEELAEAFCRAHNFTGETLAAARAALPGGDAPFWI